MLRIVPLVESVEGVVLQVEGDLRAPWVDILDTECRIRMDSAPLVLDVEHVTHTDAAGRALLRRLGREGVRLRRCSPLLEAMLQEDPVP